MNSIKPKGGGKSAKTARAVPDRWPKGHPLAGKFAPRDLFREFQQNLKELQKEQKRLERNEKAREKRAAARTEKAKTTKPAKGKAKAPATPNKGKDQGPQLAQFTPAEKREIKNARLRIARQKIRDARNKILGADNHAGTALNEAMGDWGSTSASRLREGSTYYWHGAFEIQGINPESITAMLNHIGSSARTPTKNADGTYSVIVTPTFMYFTTETVFSTLPNGETFLENQMSSMQAQLESWGGIVKPLGAFYNPSRVE